MKSVNNHILQVVPEKVIMKFNAFNISPISYDIKIYNISGKKQRILILPLETKYFELKGPVSGWVLPGLPLCVSIILHATSSRTYKDWLKIRAEDEDELIEISAMPDLTHLINIPEKIDFGLVHLGKKVSSTITLSPIPEELYSFQFIFPRPNPDCQINPMKGKLTDEATEVEITYMPTAYITLDVPVQLYLPSVTASPLQFRIYAITKPATMRDEIISNLKISQKEVSKKRVKTKYPQQIRQDRKPIRTKVRLPQLTIHDTNMMLLRKSDWNKNTGFLKGPFQRDAQEELVRKNETEQIFLKKVEKLKKDNVKALSHHRTKLIDMSVPNQVLQVIMDERNTAWQELEDSLQPNYNHYNNSRPVYIQQRSVRHLNRGLDLTFSSCENNEWFVRFQNHKRFVESIRRVIIHNRLLKRLNILKMLKPEDL